MKSGTHRGYLNPDGDIEFLLRPDEKGILTAANREAGEFPGVVGIEFASYETYQYFTKGWWSRFEYKKWFRYPAPVYTKVFGFDHHVAEKNLLPGSVVQDSPVTITGIFGLDNEHDAHPEIHPVYAMAFKIKSPDGTPFWPIFARNWATGGSCADRLIDQRIDCSSISIRLPESRLPHEQVRASLWDQKGRGAACRAFNDDGGVVVVVDLPTESNGLVYGEIRLVGAGLEPPSDGESSICAEGRTADFRFSAPPRLSWRPSVYTTIISPKKAAAKP